MSLPDGYELVASVSVGIALTEPGKTADDVLRDADVAMYEAKAKGKGGSYKVFDQAAMGTRSSQRLQIEADLRKGLSGTNSRCITSRSSRSAGERIVGAEALVRWRHPAHGLIDPMKFIPMAEETGLILPLGRYVLERACQQVRSIRDRLGVDLPISINLSPRQFQESGLLSQVAAALDASGLPSELLIFEITETMVMEDLAGAREVMKRLNRLGVRLAIDDFGTGHSSLAYLKQFPVHEVKVDRVFVQGIAESPVDSAIVRAVIDLANAMDIATVAEGVETRDAGRRAAACSAATWRRATTSRRRCRPGSSTRNWPVISPPPCYRTPRLSRYRRLRRDLRSLTPITTRAVASTSHGARMSRSLPVMAPLLNFLNARCRVLPPVNRLRTRSA